LVDGLSARSHRTRFECAGALDQFGDASTRAPLARLMDDRVPRVRWMAMHALTCHACGEKSGALEDVVRERIIAAAVGDESVHVRRHAAVALALAGETAAAAVLERMLSHETDRRLRVGVAWALGELTRPAKSVPAGV
jgi:HEAT repeat protein